MRLSRSGGKVANSDSGFSRLSASWVEWTDRARMPGVAVSQACTDCAISFLAEDDSFHLRQENGWWLIDRVNDRGHRYNDIARLSTLDLTMKFLIWRWITNARSDLSSGRLGAALHKQGYAPGITVTDMNGTRAKLCLHDQCAVLSLSTATVFSHIMLMSVDELEQIGRS
jgi:hypothetical protein